ncbi:MAG: MFS transporter [Meiothermus sp.]|nr:MFS transporter [Meiothermus sp.]
MRWLEKLPWNPQSLPALLSLALVIGMLEMVKTALFVVYLPLSRESLGIEYVAIGVAWTIHTLIASFSRPIGGWMVQRFGLGLVAFAAGLAGIATIAVITQHTNVWLFWVMCAVWGLFMSAMLPGLFTLSSRIAVVGREGRALAYTNFLLMPWVGLGWVLGTFVTKNFAEAALEALLITQAVATILALTAYKIREPIPTERFEWRHLSPILIIVPVAFAQTFAPAFLTLTAIKYTTVTLGFFEWQLYLAIGLAATVAFGGTAIIGRIADRGDARIPLVAGLLLMALVFVLISRQPEYGQFVLLLIVGGIAYATFVPSWNAMLVRLMPLDNRATIWGALMVVEGIGDATGPTVGTLLWDTLGPGGPFIGAAVIFIIVALFYALVFNKLLGDRSKSPVER